MRERSTVPSGRPGVAILLVVLGVVAAVVIAGLALGPRGTPQVAAPTPTPTVIATATATSIPTATATQVAAQTASLPRVCQEISYQSGDTAIVPPRLSGQHLQVALDYVRPGRDGNNRWGVRFFVPEGAPGDALIPLSASVTGQSGPLVIGRYQAGPPNAGAVDVTQPVTLQPCSTTAPPGTRGTILVTAESAPVRSGTYTLTWSDIGLPEGGKRTETWTVTLTCQLDPGPAQPPATTCK